MVFLPVPRPLPVLLLDLCDEVDLEAVLVFEEDLPEDVGVTVFLDEACCLKPLANVPSECLLCFLACRDLALDADDALFLREDADFVRLVVIEFVALRVVLPLVILAMVRYIDF